jgi:hypothetical protein
MLPALECAMALPPKVCPECESEYMHTVTSCVHCDVELVPFEELVAAPASELPPSSELSLVRAAGMGWVVSLSERLVEAAIPHRVDPLEKRDEGSGNPPGPYGVYVRERDLDAAQRIDAAHIAHEIPDAHEASGHAVAEDACPACGDPISESDAECAGCGLAFGPVE